MLKLFTRTFFGQRNQERIFDQAIADLREEYFDALARDARAEAMFARLRGYVSIAKAAGLLVWIKLIGKKLEGLTK